MIIIPEFDKDKFREAIYKAKLMCYMTQSRHPAKTTILKHMRELSDELQAECDKLLGE